MPNSETLLQLIRRGADAQQIIIEMGLSPAHLKRMLAGKRLRKALRLQKELATLIATHRMATAIQDVSERLLDLAGCNNEETVRKACAQMLEEGLSHASRPNVENLGLTLADLVKIGKLPCHVLLYERDMTVEQKQNVIAKALQEAAKNSDDPREKP